MHEFNIYSDKEDITRPDQYKMSENMFDDALIVISNLIARATTKWTLEETKLFLCSVSQIQTRDLNNWVTMSKRDIAETLNIDKSNRPKMRDMFKRVMQKSYIQIDGETEEEWNDGFLITQIKSTKKEISVRFNDTYVPLLDKLTSHFTEFYLDYVKEFKNLSSYNLYVFLCSWHDSDYPNQKKKIAKRDLAKVFNLKEGQYWRNYGKENAKFDWASFERFVLNPATKEINELKSCDMHILSCEKIKKGKFVLGYEFEYVFVGEDGYPK